jgi:hypothetical protein
MLPDNRVEAMKKHGSAHFEMRGIEGRSIEFWLATEATKATDEEPS